MHIIKYIKNQYRQGFRGYPGAFQHIPFLLLKNAWPMPGEITELSM